jgi:hypothetical protein
VAGRRNSGSLCSGRAAPDGRAAGIRNGRTRAVADASDRGARGPTSAERFCGWYSVSKSYGDTNPEPNGDTDSNRQTNSNTKALSHAEGESDAEAIAYRNTEAEAFAYSAQEGNASARAFAATHADGFAETDHRTDPDCRVRGEK